MPRLLSTGADPIRPKITGDRLVSSIHRYATAHSLNTTAAIHTLLTKALRAEKFLPEIDSTHPVDNPVDYVKEESQ